MPVSAALKLAPGGKRTFVVAFVANRRGLLGAGEPNAVQLLPPSVVYCHVPWVLSTAVTAMPELALELASVTWPEINADTSVPVLDASTTSSLIAVRLFAPARTGAAFGAKAMPRN